MRTSRREACVLVDVACPDLPWPGTDAATAEVSVDRLAALLLAAGRIPPGVDVSVTAGPALWLGIEAAGVVVHVDWTAADAVTGRTASSEALLNCFCLPSSRL